MRLIIQAMGLLVLGMGCSGMYFASKQKRYSLAGSFLLCLIAGITILVLSFMMSA